jgi:hypothetical protein
LPNQVNSSFDDLFDQTLRDPTMSRLVAKLRYRFGE